MVLEEVIQNYPFVTIPDMHMIFYNRHIVSCINDWKTAYF